jgi:putative phosphoribosyl transferase
MRAAITTLRQQQPASLVVAVPVAPPEVYRDFWGVVDKIVCLSTPQPFHAISLWYEDFAQTSDAEVQTILNQAGQSETVEAI